jgi:hypothetical protein
VASVGLLAHAPYTAHKEDADHGQHNYSKSNVANHRSPRAQTNCNTALIKDDNFKNAHATPPMSTWARCPPIYERDLAQAFPPRKRVSQ